MCRLVCVVLFVLFVGLCTAVYSRDKYSVPLYMYKMRLLRLVLRLIVEYNKRIKNI